MKEVVDFGKSIEDIRKKWANEWKCSPEALTIEILDKRGVFQRTWKVKVMLEETEEGNLFPENTRVSWDGEKYLIFPGNEVETVVPFPLAGRLKYDGQERFEEFRIKQGDMLEFYPITKKGELTWILEIFPDGSKAVAKVKHEHAGRYVLEKEIPKMTRLILERYISWEASPESGEVWTEEQLKNELREKGIIYGIKPTVWLDFLTVDGEEEVVVAEQTPPVPPVHAQLQDFVGEPVYQNDESDQKRIDYFACKLRICEKDEVLARKIPGKEGTPGTDIFGNTLPVEKMKDFEFTLKQNVYLSDDGLEVRAACAGIPVRVNNYTYLVENAYILNKDVDLATGSIDFPGDVFIGGDVQEGLYVNSEGKIYVQGSVSGASLKAECGILVKNNVIASKIVLGEKHVFRSQFVKKLKEINEELTLCLSQVEQLQQVSGNFNVGQLLKILLERNFQLLPKKVEEAEKLLDTKDQQFINQELEVAVKTLKHFLVGLGPLRLKNLVFLKNAKKVITHFLSTKGELVSANVVCDTNYVQNSHIQCAGDFVCHKGVYNSTINVEGNLKIFGVCRGGEITCGGEVYIWELGGSTVSSTVLKTAKNSKLSIDFCHPNVKIYVGKELVRIDQPVQKLEIYRKNGLLQVEKLRWDQED